MRIPILLGICLASLVAASGTVTAKNFATLQFSGEITSLTTEYTDHEEGFAEGREISGTLIIDLDAPEIELDERTSLSESMFDYRRSQGAQFNVQIGNRLIQSSPGNVMGLSDYFYSHLTQYNLQTQTPYLGCRINFKSRGPRQEQGQFGETFELTFNRQDCRQADEKKLSLPNSLNDIDWNWIRLTATFPEKGQTVGFIAEITSFEIASIESGTVSGSIFADYNSNCEDDEDKYSGRNVIKFTPGPYYGVSNSAGEYSTILPVGTYTAEVLERPLWKFTCENGTSELEMTEAGQALQASYAVEPTELVQALDVSIGAGFARPGFAMTYCIRLENVGTLPYSGTVRFRHDGILTDFKSKPAADSYSNPEAEWHIDDLPIGAVRFIKISMKVPADETLLRTFICSEVESEVDRKIEDEILRTAADKICTEVRGAYDPNDIQVFSGTSSADGSITRDDKILNYLIRFQNEGNESAITVRVVDKLSAFHNIESVRFGASSHPAEITITNDGELEWTFNDIDLVPKSVDEAASQGFVKFEVRLKDELAMGTEIPNKAAIYFDFNRPVITNTVISRLANSATSVKAELDEQLVRIHPNPTSDRLTVRFEQPGETTLTLRNVLGQTMLSETVNSAVHSLDLRALAVGSYYLTVETAAGSLVKAVHVAR